MTDMQPKTIIDWSCDQISKYRDILPRYEQYAVTLRQVLDEAIRDLSPHAIVQTRPKSIASFAEKIQRKRRTYDNVDAPYDPISQFTDLCGGRVITFTPLEVQAVCEFVLQHFEIDWENSVDVSQRLKPTEFGYRSVHYIIQFRPDLFPTDTIRVTVPDEVFGLKAEIQVRTLLEHAWAGFSHDRVYKSGFVVPQEWQRELASVAAMLEQADDAFSRIEHGLQQYAANYGAYMTKDELRAEMMLLEVVLACDPHNFELLHRIGKLAMVLGEWSKAVEAFEQHKELANQPLLRDLGVSLCKLHAGNPSSSEYRRGQEYLESICKPSNRDPDAFASLAGTYKRSDPDKARDLYRRAFEIDPTDPYAVSNYLVAEVVSQRSVAAVSLTTPMIATAMQRCRDQIKVNVNLPWAYYASGTLQMLLDQPEESFLAYAKAIQLSPSAWYLETSLRTIAPLGIVGGHLRGHEWVTHLLLIALAGKYGLENYRADIRATDLPEIVLPEGQTVILVGSCDADSEKQMAGYRSLLLDAFSKHRGTIISGGTTAGVAGLVGEIQEAYPTKIHTIGYIPRSTSFRVEADPRYRTLRETTSDTFALPCPLKYWADIVANQIEPSHVKLIGIGGGAITAVELRMALALGARVAILEGSGRQAEQLLKDNEWNDSSNLILLPTDARALQSFLSNP